LPDNGPPVPLAALSARVVHGCDGAPLPATNDLNRIGKDAIHVFLICSDLNLDLAAQTVSPRPPDHPDDMPF
jgi:hypothetical protein